MATLTARWLNSASQYALALAVWEACFDLAAFVCARGYAETAFAARVAGLPAERLTAHDALADELLGALSRDASVARLDYFISANDYISFAVTVFGLLSEKCLANRIIHSSAAVEACSCVAESETRTFSSRQCREVRWTSGGGRAGI